MQVADEQMAAIHGIRVEMARLESCVSELLAHVHTRQEQQARARVRGHHNSALQVSRKLLSSQLCGRSVPTANCRVLHLSKAVLEALKWAVQVRCEALPLLDMTETRGLCCQTVSCYK